MGNKAHVKHYLTLGDIEWYEIDKYTYEGFNRLTHSWDYTLERDMKSELWVVKGQGKGKASHYRQDLMEYVSK